MKNKKISEQKRLNYSNKIYLVKNRALLTQKLFIIIFCIIIGTLFSILINFNWKYSAIIPAIILLFYLFKTPKAAYILAILSSVFFTFVHLPTFSLSGLTIGLNPYKILIISGPEGSFHNDEITFFQKHNFDFINLGNNILKAETAPIIITSIFYNFFFYTFNK